jgi:hypothetical protein
MAIVMFERRALRCEGVVVLVRDLPAGSAGLHDGLHAGAIQGVLGRKRMARQEGPIRLFGEGAFTPIDPSRVFALAQGDVGGIPRGVDIVKPPIPAAHGDLREIPRGVSPSQPLVPR